MKELLFMIAIIIGVMLFAWFLLIITWHIDTANAADLPEYTDLTFTDQVDLDARVDSVLGVCDTIRIDSSAAICAYGDTTIWFTYPRLLCRRFAGLTIMRMPYRERHPHGQFVYREELGNARLWWWEEEE